MLSPREICLENPILLYSNSTIRIVWQELWNLFEPLFVNSILEIYSKKIIQKKEGITKDISIATLQSETREGYNDVGL